MDHLSTPSFFFDKFDENFGLLGYYIQRLGSFFASFLLIKSIFDVVVIVLQGLGFVRTMLGATFHLFVLSLQTPMYETDENKNIGNFRMQNGTGNEALTALM